MLLTWIQSNVFNSTLCNKRLKSQIIPPDDSSRFTTLARIVITQDVHIVLYSHLYCGHFIDLESYFVFGRIHFKSNCQSMPYSPIIIESKYCCFSLKMIRHVFFHYSIALKLHPVGKILTAKFYFSRSSSNSYEFKFLSKV